jgi:hypothetical protein
MKIPNKIYLQWHGDQKPSKYDDELKNELGVTWCKDKIYDWDIVYYRRKLKPTPKAKP